MSKSNDDELPASTLGGAQDKFIANRIDGRYVAVEPPGPLTISSHPAPPLDQEKVAAFENIPGPPSLVDVIIQRSREYGSASTNNDSDGMHEYT